MSDAAVTTEDHPEPEAHHAHDGQAFTGHEALYIKLALLLAVLTAMEVAWPFLLDDGPFLLWPLLLMMAVKFWLIAAFFMHLKFDSVILTRLFYSGLFLAVGVYLVALVTFGIFGW